MAKKSYQQFCPLSYALDVVGERWTLLIIRELSLGPRRYSDLQRGLPGIGPNLLSERLKNLERNDVLVKERLPPPAATLAYRLTVRGEELLEALMPLARWGSSYLDYPPPAEDFLSPIAGISATQLMFVPEKAAGLVTEVHFPPDVFTLSETTEGLQIQQWHAFTLKEVDLIIETTPKTLFSMLAQDTEVLEEDLRDRLILKKGDITLFNRFVAQFAPPFE